MENFNIVHMYFKTLEPIFVGTSPLTNKITFSHYHEMLKSSIPFVISFIPFDNTYVSGCYDYNPDEMSFEFLQTDNGSYLIINVRNIQNIQLISLEEDRNIESTNELLTKLDPERLKKLAGIS